MTVIQKKPVNPIAHLTPEDIEQIGVELDAIRQEVIDSRGAADAAYIRKVIGTQRKLEVGSRAVLLFSLSLLNDLLTRNALLEGNVGQIRANLQAEAMIRNAEVVRR